MPGAAAHSGEDIKGTVRKQPAAQQGEAAGAMRGTQASRAGGVFILETPVCPGAYSESVPEHSLPPCEPTQRDRNASCLYPERPGRRQRRGEAPCERPGHSATRQVHPRRQRGPPGRVGAGQRRRLRTAVRAKDTVRAEDARGRWRTAAHAGRGGFCLLSVTVPSSNHL